ncbi:MAG: hypothetical protein F6K65_15365 [Moorea sp. SIO3C2]|nr:hypothetical protein [Moorena sp. SIO3C2]
MNTYEISTSDCSLVGSAYLGVPKQINLSVALPTLHLHCPPYIFSRFPIPDSRFPIASSLVGSAYLGVRHQINLSVALPTLHLLHLLPIPDSRCPIPSAAYQTLPEFMG